MTDTTEALRMAIEYLRECHNEMYANGFQGGYRCIEIIDACKAALEIQEISDTEIKQMLDDIEWYQQEQRKLIDRIKELDSKKQEDALDRMAENARELGLEWEGEPRLVSYAPDGSTCTLNIDGDEVYFNRVSQASEQEPVQWKNVALRLGEELSSVGPDNYYAFTPEQWLRWALQNTKQHTINVLNSHQTQSQNEGFGSENFKRHMELNGNNT